GLMLQIFFAYPVWMKIVLPATTQVSIIIFAAGGACDLLYRNHTDFYIHKFWQCRYLDCFSCREVACKIFSIYFIDLSETIHICDEDGRFNNIAEVHTSGCKYCLQVMHYLVSFFLYIFIFKLTTHRIDADLAGNKKHMVRLNSLVVWTDRCRSIGCIDDCS